MLDIKKIDMESTKIIRSYTKEQLLEWVEMDKKRMAFAKKEESKLRTPDLPLAIPANPALIGIIKMSCFFHFFLRMTTDVGATLAVA